MRHHLQLHLYFCGYICDRSTVIILHCPHDVTSPNAFNLCVICVTAIKSNVSQLQHNPDNQSPAMASITAITAHGNIDNRSCTRLQRQQQQSVKELDN